MAKRTMKAAQIVVFALAAIGSSGLAAEQTLSVGGAAAPCLNLRSAPAADAAVVRCLPPGTRLQALGTRGAWTRAQVPGGAAGWAATRFLGPAEQLPRTTVVPAIELEATIDSRSVPLGITLYDQTDSPAGAGFISQLFEAANSAFDCRAADDFNVPAVDIQWDLVGVQVLGAYIQGAGLMPLLDLEFFPDGGGVPGGAASCSYLGLVAGVDFIDDGAGNLDVTLPATCSLPAGDYWLSVRADMDLAAGGQWLWGERGVQNGATFAWENPPDGFGTGCVAWTPANACGASAPDLLFALSGTMVPVELQSIAVD